MVSVELVVRLAVAKDEQQIANLLHFEPYVHRHLDWRAPLDWLGNPYYWLLERNGRAVAALACPPDPEYIYWLRLFTCAQSLSVAEAWGSLWNATLPHLDGKGQVAAIVLHDWMLPLLRESGFKLTQNIVMLEWNGRGTPRQTALSGITLRPMQMDDLPRVARLDVEAFAPLWCNSLAALKSAFAQAGHATVAEADGELIGYQITTQNPFSAHLARLAVHPNVQRSGLGYALVSNLINVMKERGLSRVTVNTQADNAASLALYQKIGFYRTHESYPVYVYNLQEK
jgi:ribosomal protein S18 acetylase RimI-like enzyme